MATTTPIPNPVPTPYQPPALGGVVQTPYNNNAQTPAQGGSTGALTGPGYGNYGSGDRYVPPTTPVVTTPTNQPTTPPPNNNPAPKDYSGDVGYNPSFNGQTVSIGGVTYHADNGKWVPQAAPTGPSEGELNAVYDPTMNYLKQAEDYINGQQPGVQNTINSQTASANAELLGNRNKNLSTINENQLTTQNRYEDAQAGARRLYDELRRGYGQRFGGSTSAGQAASELASVEQQRQMGQTGRDYNTATRQIDQQKVQLEQDYQTGQAKVVEQKNMALQQAQTNFTQQLMQIQSQRAQTESQKAAAKLQALTDLRNQAYQTQQQATQYQQNLDMFYKQQQADLTTYAQKLQMAGQGSSTAINSFLGNTTAKPTSNLQTGATTTGANTTPTGSIKKPEDYAGFVGSTTPSGVKSSTYDPYGLYQNTY